ncbi:MAG: bifunctional folylpolyglutamate synthase/dihydrofolate synthase [Blautia sp.]
MNYEEAVAYIEETPKFTTKNKLSHTKECLRRLGNPEKKFRVIHVAGTNGKGSTCAFLTSIFREAGYSCGLFTSPHLVTINERFQINEQNIDDDTFLAAFLKVRALADELVAEGSYHPTYFEMLFLMGMVIFADAGVDYVMLETGLGGRLDATTAVEEPAACVITSISFDHMQYLGNTIREIAGEKAGIIVPGVPVIFDGNDQEAAKVIRDQAEKLGSPWFEVKREDAEIKGITSGGIDFSVKNGYYGNTVFSIPFIARYQVMNASLVLKTVEVLKQQISIPEDAVKKGLLETRWQGRMETVLPGVIVDGAHNEDGVEKFVETAEHFQKEYPLTLLFSAVDDKDYTDMIRTILGRIRFRHVVVTQVGGYRKVPAEELAEIFRREGCPSAQAFEDTEMAFRAALSLKGEDGMLFCVGSLYLVGEIKELLRKEDAND